MNILLRFKSYKHETRFHENLELYTSRMIVTHSVLCLVVIPFTPFVQYFAYRDAASVGLIIQRTALTYIMNIALLILSILLRRFRRNLAKRHNAIRWALDILYCLVEVYEGYFWNQGLVLRGSSQVYFWGWWNCLTAVIKINVISRWYMKLIAYLILIMLFGIKTYVLQTDYSILLTLVQAIIFLGLQTYFQERSDKKRFLEKQALFEETEALQEIIEQTTEAIMIYGIDEGVLFKNSNKYEWWNDNLPFELNLSKVRLDQKSNTGTSHRQQQLLTTEAVEINVRSDLFALIEGLRADYRHNLKKKTNFHPRQTEESSQNNLRLVYGEVNSEENDKVYQLEIRILYMSFREKPALALIISDITQRNTIITLQDNNNYKNRLLASVSHELRTPLNASINFTRMAIEDPSVPANIKNEYLAPSMVSSQLLLHLINDILDFSQISANKLRLVYEKLNFRDSIDQCVNLIRLQASRKKIELETDYQMSGLTPDFCTDHNRLKQIVLNLLSNAIKFTLSGKITVKAKLDYKPSSFPELVTSTMRKQLHVFVEDTGIGMSQADQKKLFQAFEKIELGDRVALNSTGVGLGLVISNNLVIMLNQPSSVDNHIRVESQKDVGTKFSFTILEQEGNSGILSGRNSQDENYDNNIEENPLQEEELRMGKARETLARKTIYFTKPELLKMGPSFNKIEKFTCTCPPILVVDDDIFNVTALESILKKLGFACDTAFNGKQAIERILERNKGKNCGLFCSPSYRAILMDCSMPIMDGFESSKVLKDMMQKKEIADTPIVACTAFVQEREKLRAQEAGMEFHIVKPITQEKIRSILRKVDNYYSNK